jgi:hypothetical protein
MVHGHRIRRGTGRRLRTLATALVILGVSAAVWPARPAAPAGRVPQELLGFRLGDPIQVVRDSTGRNTIGGRPMVVVKDTYYEAALRAGPEVVMFRECPGGAPDRCAWQPQPESVPPDRVDEPGSLVLFISRPGQPRLLGVGFKLNPRRWRRTPFEKAGDSFRSTYGHPEKVSPPRQHTVTTGPGWKFVTGFASWQWTDRTARLFVRGNGVDLPGTFTNPEPAYTYLLYAERIDLRRAADELIEKRRPKATER